MEQTAKQQLDKVVQDFPPEDIQALIAFAKYLYEQRQLNTPSTPSIEDNMTEEEHAQLIQTLNAVTILSSASGPSVDGREHDQYLYGHV